MNLDQLLRETSSVATPQTLPPWSPPAEESPRRRVVTGRRLSVAAAVIAAVVIVPTLSTGGGRPSGTADAAAVLHSAGVAAGNQPDGDWKDATYWHTTTSYVMDGKTIIRQVWIGHHSRGVLKDPGVAAGVIPLDWPDFEGVPWDGLWTLPTTTQELRAKVRDLAGTAGDNVDQEMFVVIGDLLRESPAPPKLRAALYEVAGTIPGVRLLGPMTDHAGRHGVAVSRDGQTLIFDPDDGRLLEDRVASSVGTPVANAGPSGQIVTSSPAWVGTFLDQGPSETAPSPDGS